MTIDEGSLPFSYPAEPETAVSTAKPRRHRHVYDCGAYRSIGADLIGVTWVPDSDCACGARRDPTASRRGRTNRSRGNAIEREVGKALGLKRVGMYGGPDDLSGEMFSVQVKSGGSFSDRYWRWLQAIPANAGQTKLLVVTDAPGPGHRRRAMVCVELTDWISLHGETQ